MGMDMKKLCEYEIQGTSVTPEQFFIYCKNRLQKKGVDIENWINYENWKNPIAPCNYMSAHEDWKEPQKEICILQPFNCQLFLENAYNFIMEFFWYCNIGFGNLYISF